MMRVLHLYMIMVKGISPFFQVKSEGYFYMQSDMLNGIKSIAVIGAGIFGCTAALALAKTGYKVVLFERLPDIIMGTSENNTNRIHQGFHYPRDMKTAIECRDNYRRFETEFREALIDDYPNIYCIAEKFSYTSKEEFIKFCDALGLSYSMIDLNRFDVKINGCNLGISCQETIIDSDLLRNMLISKIKNIRNLMLSCNTEVATIKKNGPQYELSFLSEAQSKESFDAVVNCSYANISTLTEQLGYEVRDSQYEYTVVPIIDLDFSPRAITIMDGPFMTLFPYGKTKKFLVYHVDFSVIEAEIAKTLNPDWLDPKKSPLANVDQSKYFDAMIEQCSNYVPALANAELIGYLEAPRMVLPKHEQDDARPSFVTDYGDGYYTVFSGKIDRSLSIADSICLKLNDYFRNRAQ